MSLRETKEQLIQLLADEDNKVIALSGRWGTGKSFMWEQVKQAASDDKIKGSLYTSLFGASSIDQVKLKLIQSSAKSAKEYPTLFKGIKQAYRTTVKALEGINSGFSALNDIGLLIAPAVLRQKIIVLDDIERKHERLSIDEVLGFIDEFTKRHGSRVLLILNDDQLDERDVWNDLREKVIDQELRLTTSASEAFEIGIGIVPSQWAAQIRPNIERCGVNNIRIVCRIIKAINRMIGNRRELSDAVLARVIPSTVLLAAIHYKGIEDGPDFDFVLAQGTPNDWSLREARDDAKSDDERRKSNWKILLNELSIYGCDEFELLVVEFLQSGLFDAKKLTEVIDSYVAEAEVMEAREQCNRFFERSTWDHRLDDQQLLEEAAPVVDKANHIDPYMVTSLYDILVRIPGGQVLADSAVDRWIESFRAQNLQDVELDNVFGRKIHPRVEAEFKAISANVLANTSVFEACEAIVKRSGWGTREEVAMKTATVEDFEAVIRNASISDLRLFMAKMLNLCANKAVYVPHFGSAMDHFAEACRRIAEDVNSPRLAALVKSLFASANISAQLDPPEPLQAAQPDAPVFP